MTSIVIPAHNEQRGLPRLLRALGYPGSVSLEVVVVANGCTDGTADVARDLGATVVETPVASKTHALAVGDSRTTSFPRVYIDGDVVIDAAGVTRLCEALVDGVHASGPERVFPMQGVSLPVRWYYEVWSGLEGVTSELYGRGVIAVDAVGHARLANWPDVISDDKFVASSFGPTERRVVPEASVTIWPPKTYPDLLRRRIRVATGNAQFDMPKLGESASRETLGHLGRLSLKHPRAVPRIAVFGATTVIARVGGQLATRRRDNHWLRDESSRA